MNEALEVARAEANAAAKALALSVVTNYYQSDADPTVCLARASTTTVNSTTVTTTSTTYVPGSCVYTELELCGAGLLPSACELSSVQAACPVMCDADCVATPTPAPTADACRAHTAAAVETLREEKEALQAQLQEKEDAINGACSTLAMRGYRRRP